MLLELKAPFSEAGIVVITGVAIVFLGMVMLTAILYIMSAIGKKSANGKKNVPEKAAEEIVSAPVAEAVSDSEDDEICAVIAAAISAYYAEKGKTSSIKASEVKRICRRVNAERKNG